MATDSRSVEQFAEVLARVLEELDLLYINDLYGDGRPVRAFWSDDRQHPGRCSVYFGSPAGGPIFHLAVGRLESTMEDHIRSNLQEIHDRAWAESYGESLEEFRANLAKGHLYDGYHSIPPAVRGDADHS